MTKHDYRIDLSLDKHSGKSGETLTGTVYLSKHCPRLFLTFTGEEEVCIRLPPSHELASRRIHEDDVDPKLRQSTYTFARQSIPLITATSIDQEEDHSLVEFPLQWQIPSDLPGSMRATDDKDGSYCEIRYTLSLSLGPSCESLCQHAISVRAERTRELEEDCNTNSTRTMDLQHVPIQTCCCTTKDFVELGLNVDKTIVEPGTAIKVDIQGQNRSRYPVSYVRVCWNETILWRTFDANGSYRPGLERRLSQTLVERRIPVDEWPVWLPVGHPQHLEDEYRSLQDDNHHKVTLRTVRMRVPSDALDSYSGQLLFVRHALVASVVTSGCCISSPESSVVVRVRQAPRTNQSSTPLVPV